MSASEALLGRLFAAADIRIGGHRPWDPDVRDRRFYRRVLVGGSLALGESYVDGWWDAARLDEFFFRALRAGLDRHVRPPWRPLTQRLAARLMRMQSPARSGRSARHHYDLGNEFFEVMLDRRMVYSCGYWRDAATLDEAQEAKLDLVCRKLGLLPGQRVLDIGCGWGSWARFAAERYGVEVVGITLSPAQVQRGRALCEGLPVELRLQDYRTPAGRFDHIVSIGMMEHVGARNFRHYMRMAREQLAPGGLFLLHTIGGEETAAGTDPWVHKYIFPNSLLPSPRQLTESMEGLFVIEDWQNFGVDYDRTLTTWWANCESGWHRLGPRYDERFRRRWKYYLLSCAGAFRARRNQVWQLVLSRQGVLGGYQGPARPGRTAGARAYSASPSMIAR